MVVLSLIRFQTLKYTACQDYMIYLCRGEQPLIDVECWIDCLGMKTALNTPVDGLSHLLDQLRLVDEPFGEYFRENRFEQIIMDPMVLLEHNAFMSFMVTGKKPSNLLRFKSQPPTEIGSSLKVRRYHRGSNIVLTILLARRKVCHRARDSALLSKAEPRLCNTGNCPGRLR